MEKISAAMLPQKSVDVIALKWIGTLAVILGTALTSLAVDGWNVISFTVGSVAWLYVGWRWHEMSLWLLNGILLAVNIAGLYRVYMA